MSTRHSFSVTFLPLLSLSASMHTAMLLFAFRDSPIADHKGLLLWWGFLIVYHTVMSKFLQTPRELRSIVILSGCILVCQLGVTLYLNPIYPSFTWWLISVAMWVCTYYRSALSIWDGVKPESLMGTFEITVMTLLIAAVVISGHAMASGVLLHLCIGTLCILIAMMRLRTQHTRINTETGRSSSEFMLPLLLVVMAGIVIAFCAIISGSAAQLLTLVTAWLTRVLSAIANAVGAFLFWLLSLFPNEFEPIDDDSFAGPSLPSLQQEEMASNNGIMLYILIFAILVGLIVSLLKVWRQVRLHGSSRSRRSAASVVVKQLGIVELIRSLIEKIFRRCRFQADYLRNRNTAPGLLVWLERQMRRKRMGRKRGETTAAFLARLGTRYPHCRQELQQLSFHLDRHYFGICENNLSAETVRDLRRTIKRAISADKTSV